ncbi:MAG: NUDIX domain-containing protein [Oscillospiraceae bacterium]|jgi:8-oxo-dGTP pyrophosphatase MutT (NUDIX family)|nr:NUDIX domain-containing protein [Oscillospiraceae bacterium]
MNRTSDEKSCGAVIFRQTRGVRRFLLIQSAYSGAWGFPKGHMEAGESEGDTAVREIREEVGLTVGFLPDFRVSISYPLPTGAMKEVVYFLAEAADAEAHLQRAEVRSAVWLPAEQVLELLSFDNLRAVFRAALLYLRADGASEPAPIVN